MPANQPTPGRFNAAILIASDRSYQQVRPDKTGPLLKDYIEKSGYDVAFFEIVPDNKDTIVTTLRKLSRNLLRYSRFKTDLSGSNWVWPETCREMVCVNRWCIKSLLNIHPEYHIV